MDILQAIEDGDLEEVVSYLEEGGNIEKTDLGERTLLMNAIKHGCFEIAEFLIEKGADVNARTRANRTALMFACRKGSFKIVELLIEKGADIHVVSLINSATALLYAYESHDFQIAKYLLKKGASFTFTLKTAYLSATLSMFLLAIAKKHPLSSSDSKFLRDRNFKANLGKYVL